MQYLRRALLLAGVAGLLAAPGALAQPTEAEFKCEQAVSKFGAKFTGAKSKCVQKCLANFWKGIGSDTDCLPPYSGSAALCIVNDPIKPGKSAEQKFVAAIQKACDPAVKEGTDCPECYAGGDCSEAGFAGAQMQNLEGQIDSFVPGVACERVGASKEDQACQTATAKALTKQVGSVVKCYDKCKKNEFKALIPPGSCTPPPGDAATQTCVNTASSKAILAADKKCGTLGIIPDCAGGESNDYPSGTQWVNLVDIAISGNIPTTYCE